MNKIKQRDYYKIFKNTNQTEDSEDLCLGYEAETTEIVLKKDQTTFFHFPFFTSILPLSSSTLGADGAAPGPIPAMADRIFKKLGNYGKTTPWGTTIQRQNGTWLCSWFYKPQDGLPYWVDRFYNPGRIAYKEALEGNANFDDYVKNDPIYYDVPSRLVFEPGNYYQFFHRGEKTTEELIKTFAGNDMTNLKLDIENWIGIDPDQPQAVDSSIFNNQVVIESFNTSWIEEIKEPGYIDKSTLSFDNTDFIDCRVKYNENYIPKNDFTVSFWIKNKNWNNATSTQLLGNLYQSGFSFFYNNLNYNPYFVIPENFYGHLFYFNIDGEIYFDKNIQYRLGEPVSLSRVCMNLNSEIIGFDQTNNLLIKYNQIGDIITKSQNLSGENIVIDGQDKGLILDGNNNIILITTAGTYIFDQNLVFQSFKSENKNTIQESFAFDVNGVLNNELSCIDLKFDNNNNKWAIKPLNNSQRLYYNNNIFTELKDIECTNIAIDPNSHLWVLTNTKNIFVIDTTTGLIAKTYEINFNINDTIKNISFIQQYIRKNNNFQWFVYVYGNVSKTLYQITLDGQLFKTTFLPQKLNILDSITSTQDKNLLSFTGLGDFTGYEQRRIFHKILYNNNPQIQFKVTEQSNQIFLPNTITTLSVPVTYLVDDTWHLITLTYRNKKADLYIDGFKRDTIILINNIDFKFKNDLIIGCPNGKNTILNNEIKSNNVIWNGSIDSIKIYDYNLPEEKIFLLAENKILGSDIEWNINTAPLQYLDVIERVFKHRMPGHKSNFFNIKISGSQVKDVKTRKIIEDNIRAAIINTKPLYTELLRVEWID